MMKYLTRYGEKLSIGDEVLVQGINELTSAKVMNVSNISIRGKYILQNHATFVMICRKKITFPCEFCMCYGSNLLTIFPHFRYYNV